MHRTQMTEILVVDIEATCWNTLDYPNEPQGDQKQEIIEVGVTRVDLPKARIVEKGGFYVRPQRSTPGAFCTNLTGITSATVAGAMSFAEGCEYLRDEFGSNVKPWASWGNFDRTLFDRQCRRDKVNFPFSGTHFNLKAMHAMLLGWRWQRGMSGGLNDVGLEFEGRQHSGADDAYNTARVLVALLKQMRG